MRLPRDLTGAELAMLLKQYGYEITASDRQPYTPDDDGGWRASCDHSRTQSPASRNPKCGAAGCSCSAWGMHKRRC